jgi:hypothetical protein
MTEGGDRETGRPRAHLYRTRRPMIHSLMTHSQATRTNDPRMILRGTCDEDERTPLFGR